MNNGKGSVGKLKQIPIISSVMLCENTKLSAQHQIKFKNKSDQLSYFKSRAKYQLNNVSYIKSNNYFSGTVRLPIAFTSLLSCDYIVYSNPTDSGQLRTYFSRIDNIRYIDALTSEISFSLDFYQTFLFEYSVLSALTEREHIAKADDKVGFNHEPEPHLFQLVKIDKDPQEAVNLVSELVIMLYVKPATPASVATNLTTPILNGVAYPGDIYAFPFTNDGFYMYRSKLQELMGQDGVSLGIFSLTVDRVFLVPNPGNLLDLEFKNNICKLDKIKNKLLAGSAAFHYFSLPFFTNVDVKNKKCLQQPFMTVKIQTSQGAQIESIGIERFTKGLLDDIPNVKLCYSISFNPYPALIVRLLDYTQDSQMTIGNKSDGFHLVGFNNVLKIELPEYQVTDVQGVGKAIMQLVSILATKQEINPVLTRQSKKSITALSGLIDETKEKIDKNPNGVFVDMYKHSIESHKDSIMRSIEYEPQRSIRPIAFFEGANPIQSVSVATKGTMAGSDFTDGLSLAKMGIYVCVEVAEGLDRYDTFFTRYGYAVNEYKIPNEDTREFWNYVKTTEIEIGGNIPEIAKRQIESLYNGGFTIWHTTNILDYSQEN